MKWSTPFAIVCGLALCLALPSSAQLTNFTIIAIPLERTEWASMPRAISWGPLLSKTFNCHLIGV